MTRSSYKVHPHPYSMSSNGMFREKLYEAQSYSTLKCTKCMILTSRFLTILLSTFCVTKLSHVAILLVSINLCVTSLF